MSLVYKNKKVKLYKGDCSKIMRRFPNNCVHLTVTSPPYDNLRTYNDSLEWGPHVWKKVIKELYRITKKGGVIVWIVQDATINGDKTGTSFRQVLYMKKSGFIFHDTIIWKKPGFTSVGSLNTRYAPVFEFMFVFCKGKIKTFNPIKDRRNIGASGIVTKRPNIVQRDGSIRNPNKTYITREWGQRFNIWEANPSNSQIPHPAMFPKHLARDHIISWSNENDIVLDPFMGSGTTGCACINLNRKFIGIEKEKKYCKIAIKRIQNTKPARKGLIY